MYPFIFVSEGIGFSTYFLILSFVYCFILYLGWQQAQKHPLINLSTFIYCSLVSMLAGFWGARLWYFALVFPFTPQAPLLGEQGLGHWSYFFHFWQGGFVLYGGILGALLANALFLLWRKEPLGLWLDFMAPLISLGHALGRWACFFAGCCYGKPSTLPWAFPSSLQDTVHRHPTALYTFLLEICIFVFLKYLEKKRRENKNQFLILPRGNLFLIWFFLHTLGRFIIEGFRGDLRGPFFQGFSLLAWISLFLALATGAILAGRSKKFFKNST